MLTSSKLLTVLTVLTLSFDIQSWCPMSMHGQGIGFVSASPVPVPMIKKMFNAIKDTGAAHHHAIKEKIWHKPSDPYATPNQQPPYNNGYNPYPAQYAPPPPQQQQQMGNQQPPNNYGQINPYPAPQPEVNPPTVTFASVPPSSTPNDSIPSMKATETKKDDKNKSQTVDNLDTNEYVPPPDYRAMKKASEDSPASKRFCSDCGNKHQPNDKFCSECGKKRNP